MSQEREQKEREATASFRRWQQEVFSEDYGSGYFRNEEKDYLILALGLTFQEAAVEGIKELGRDAGWNRDLFF